MWDTANAIYHKDVRKKFGLSNGEYLEMIARFKVLGIVDYNPLDKEQGILHVHAGITEWIRRIDEEAHRKKAEPPPAQPNRMDQAKQWAFSKWSVVIPLIALAVLGAIVLFITNMKTVLDWFGIKK